MIALRVTCRPGAAEPDATALPVPPEGLTIGRADDCGLVLADPLRLVSRQHAQVFTEDDAVRVRCVSSSTPLWVNETQLDPGDVRPLAVGDHLRIGRFELAVEPVAAGAGHRSRLDRWFDLREAGDPLAADSPLPSVEAPVAEALSSAVVSWQTSRHVVRTAAAEAPRARDTSEESMVLSPPAPVRAAWTPRSIPVQLASNETAAAVALRPAPPPADVAVQSPVVPEAARPATDASSEARALAAAFARGAGIRAEAVQVTPEWMEHLGALMRESAEGILALLQSRAVAKRHMRAEGTHIAARQNNPLKFAPDATEALVRMLQRDPSPGFLDPVAALHDAHRDLLVHQVAMMAGMRAAVFELFSRLGPEAAESAEGAPHGASRLPWVRTAALWERHRKQHAQLLENLDDDFEAIFGREFLRAYEAQSRADADAGRSWPDPPWPGAR